jgi:hypothetical protein
VVGFPRLDLSASLDAAAELLRVTARSFPLMCRMCVIFGLEVFDLMWGAFAVASHEFSLRHNPESSTRANRRRQPPVGLEPGLAQWAR